MQKTNEKYSKQVWDANVENFVNGIITNRIKEFESIKDKVNNETK